MNLFMVFTFYFIGNKISCNYCYVLQEAENRDVNVKRKKKVLDFNEFIIGFRRNN